MTVQNGNIEGFPFFLRLVQRLQRFLAARGFGDDAFPLQKGLPQDQAVGGAIVNDEDIQSVHIDLRPRSCFRIFVRGRFCQRNGEKESAAFSRLAFHPYFSPHQFDDLSGDGQAQTRAFIFPGDGRIGLGELFKDGVKLFGGDADPRIPDRKLQKPWLFPRGILRKGEHRQDDFTFLGKFNGIAQKVHEHLTKTRRISLYSLGDIGTDTAGKFEIAVIGADSHDLTGFFNDIEEVIGYEFKT